MCAPFRLRIRSYRDLLWDRSSMNVSTLCLLISLLTFTVSTASGVQKLSVTPDQGAAVNISSTQVKGCEVCTGTGRSQQCASSVLLKDARSVSVEFKCSRPQDVFRIEINRSIDCDTHSCNGHIIQTDSDSLPLLDFNRAFTWTLKASPPRAFRIDFAETGLRQIYPTEKCPDKHIYTLQALQTTGDMTVGKYCRDGPIRSVQILNQGTFSVEVPAGQKVKNDRFDVSVGEEITTLAKITLTLPNGTSSLELLSPNFPDSFLNDGEMEWYFEVPDKHKTDVYFLNLTQPSCVKEQTMVEYKGRTTSKLRLTDPQPVQNQGNFSMTLKNCNMDRRRSSSPGLALNFKVSTSSLNAPAFSLVLCKVNLSKEQGLSLHIEKLSTASDCIMKENSVKKETITVTSSGDLSFQDCLPQDLRVSATRVIECHQLQDCGNTRLSLPTLQSCLPSRLRNMTWILRPPPHGTVELMAPGPLKQSLHGEPCNDSATVKVAEENGAVIGHFCPQGAIQNIQIHTNMSVTITSLGRSLLSTYKSVLDACFKEEITERYIFTVSPKKNTTVVLATPGWPEGMSSYSTVSWIVSVPPKMEAQLVFANISQPKCSNRHTNIRVQRVGSPEEDYSRREDEMAESEIVVSENFYLNMSNCMPENGQFSVVTEITLQQSTNLLLTIILSVVAALLVIFIIILVVVCVVIRKKKKRLEHQVSIYNPNGTNFHSFPKTRQDNESHVYASIEDTLVYTHLLRKGIEIGVYGETATCRSFTGHTDSQKPLVSKESNVSSNNDDVNTEVGVYHPFRYSSQQGPPLPKRPPSLPLVDNEIYQSEEAERSPDLGPRMEPEGGD